ncbi:hypothetical protein [Sphingobacterium hungaricum]|uniref:Uncharacterized protein n=1 Tax=Sphingobacterium hungaricum TaxID=2082723 RepID=A0A928US12_9SPHI|nr:hypothetical protein [Sphingobacterium hungaricum]MBE8712135.1 hypothetical protein [Sphingobacterium hungaricum]
MKTLTFILIALIAFTKSFAQIDSKGNPIFNSVVIGEEKFDDFELTSSYFTIANNISDKNSSVYINDNPSLSDYLKFSRDLPSYAFTVHQGEQVQLMIMLVQTNKGSETDFHYYVSNPNNGKSVEIPCAVWGEISEKRVEEFEKLKVDADAEIIELPKGTLYSFNGIAYRIQPYKELKEEVLQIIESINKVRK